MNVSMNNTKAELTAEYNVLAAKAGLPEKTYFKDKSKAIAAITAAKAALATKPTKPEPTTIPSIKPRTNSILRSVPRASRFPRKALVDAIKFAFAA